MKVVAAALALIAVSLAAPEARAQDDERTRRILERIERELTESRKKLREEIRNIIRTELRKAAAARKTPKPPAPSKKPAPPKQNLTAQIRAFADKIKDDGALNSRLRAFLKTEKGAAFIKEQLLESGEFDTFDDAVGKYCVKGSDGRYVVRAEHAAEVEEMLDQAAPVAPKKVRIGIVAEDFLPGERKKLGIRGGIKIVEVKDPAKAAGLKGGDVLLEIAGAPVTEETILKALEKHKPGDVVKFTVLRDGKRRTFDLRLVERKE